VGAVLEIIEMNFGTFKDDSNVGAVLEIIGMNFGTFKMIPTWVLWFS